VRQGELLRNVIPFTANVFGRAVIMPNTNPPITTIALARNYQQEISEALKHKANSSSLNANASKFQPLITCYATDDLDHDEVIRGFNELVFFGLKVYPKHGTTGSSHSVSNIRNLYPLFEKMQDVGMPVLLHGEVNNPEVDIFDREAVFIENVLCKLLADFPVLKICLEHITTQTGTDVVLAQYGVSNFRLAATITPQHLLFNRNHLLSGGIKPHNYCMPILKREHHREALLEVATSGHPAFFLGTDSAPHLKDTKETACGCAGCFSAPVAVELYAQAFDSVGKLDKLEQFASTNGAEFYGLPLNTDTVTLGKNPSTILDELRGIVPFMASETLGWELISF